MVGDATAFHRGARRLPCRDSPPGHARYQVRTLGTLSPPRPTSVVWDPLPPPESGGEHETRKPELGIRAWVRWIPMIESCSVRARRSDRVVDRARSCSSTEAPRGRRLRARGRVGPLVLVRRSRRVSRGVVGATMRRASAPATPRLVGRGCRWGDRTAPSSVYMARTANPRQPAIGIQTPPIVVISVHELRVLTGSAEDPS